jgi:hypothetical protein
MPGEKLKRDDQVLISDTRHEKRTANLTEAMS